MSPQQLLNNLWVDILLDLKGASTPGFCVLSKYGSTIAQILGFDGEGYDYDRIVLLYSVVLDRLYELYRGNQIADPIKIFVKQEPHKLKKLQSGKLRLISAVSLVDSVVDRVLFMPFMKNFIKNVGLTPVMIGWSPLNGGYNLFSTMLENSYKKGSKIKYCFIDKSSWDWTVPRWLIEMVKDLLKSLYPGAPIWWSEMVDLRFKLLFDSGVLFKYQDGVEAEQKIDGIMKSGCYLTILINSISQLLIHLIIEERLGVQYPMFCIGDDTIMPVPEDEDISPYVREWESFGFLLKVEVSRCPEFAGFHISNQQFIPSYRDKHGFMFQRLSLDEEIATSTLQSYQYLYFFDKEALDFIRSFIFERQLPEAFVSNMSLQKVVNA